MPKKSFDEIREVTKAARTGALEALLAKKTELTKLSVTELLIIQGIEGVKGKDTNYCCAGCSPAYSPK